MKVNEIISEDKKPLNKTAKQALPNLTTYSVLDNNNHPYLAYRFGVALAASPDDKGHTEGPIGSDFAMIDYTDGDAAIRKGAEKKMGVKPSTGTGKGSEERHDLVNTVSPVAKPKRNKYGV